MTRTRTTLACQCGTRLAACLGVLLWLASVGMWLLPVEAQSTCTPIAYVRVISGLGANVRSSPDTDTPNVVAGLRYEDGEKTACEYKDGWYRLDSPAGWVSATYGGGRALLTVRVVATPTPTPRVPTITPRPSATFTPMPTPPILLIDSNGQPYECRDLLPPQPPFVLLANGRWVSCALAPVVLSPTPTRITP